MEEGARGEALDLAQRSLAAAQSNHSGDAISDRLSVAGAYKILGDVEDRFGDKAAARTAWQGALASWPAKVAESPRQMAVRASILDALGRTAEAKALTDKLSVIGYRRII